MKTIKSITLGIIIGAIATISITALADYIINPNTYPVFVDGQEVDIEGYNINDSTYFKLRDIGDNAGFRVDFANDMILLNTESLPTPTPKPTILPVSEPLPAITTETIDGVEYVNKTDIEKMLSDIGLDTYMFTLTKFANFDGSKSPALLENIPLCPTNSDLIPYSYYQSTIIPVINSLR